MTVGPAVGQEPVGRQVGEMARVSQPAADYLQVAGDRPAVAQRRVHRAEHRDHLGGVIGNCPAQRAGGLLRREVAADQRAERAGRQHRFVPRAGQLEAQRPVERDGGRVQHRHRVAAPGEIAFTVTPYFASE